MEHFSWPIAVFALGVVFLVMFRSQVAEFLSRVRSVGRDGISAISLPHQDAIQQQTDVANREEVQLLLQSFDSPILLEHERLILTDLERRRLDTTSDTTKVLVRHLARHQVFLNCEVVYRHIFGSQIKFLKLLNSRRGVSESDATEFYASVVADFPEIFPADQPVAYFAFLAQQRLVIVVDNMFEITDFGREFLSWMIQVGVDETRPL